jgi:hypothetical protein
MAVATIGIIGRSIRPASRLTLLSAAGDWSVLALLILFLDFFLLILVLLLFLIFILVFFPASVSHCLLLSINILAARHTGCGILFSKPSYQAVGFSNSPNRLERLIPLKNLNRASHPPLVGV